MLNVSGHSILRLCPLNHIHIMQIPQPKLFFFNRIKLEILHDPDFDIYTIQITDTLTHQTFDPFGIFPTLPHAIAKFNSIQL